MAQRPFSRAQVFLVPPSLDDWLPPDHPARVVAALLDGLDAATWRRLEIERRANPDGAPRYAPEVLLGIGVYGFMTGIRSTRGLEAACRDQISFRWLSANQTPDRNTLARFYQAHQSAMREVFRQTVTVAVRAGLVDWALQAVDGTKIAANAAVERSLTAEQMTALLARTEQAIAELEARQAGDDQAGAPSLPPELRDARARRTRIAEVLADLRAGGAAKRNLTGPDAALMKTRQGIVPACNARAVVTVVPTTEAAPSGRLIVATWVTPTPTDHGRRAPMLAEAAARTGRQAAVSVADTGYVSAATLAACTEAGMTAVIPEQPPTPARRAIFPREAFTYDPMRDDYTCPAGQQLSFRGLTTNPGGRPWRRYRAPAGVCQACPLWARCTRDRRHGRALKISAEAAVVEAHRTWMTTEPARTASRARRTMIEPVFGTLKERHRGRRFLRRGLAAVQSEWHLLTAAFNLRTLHRWWQAAAGRAEPGIS